MLKLRLLPQQVQVSGVCFISFYTELQGELNLVNYLALFDLRILLLQGLVCSYWERNEEHC